MRLLVLGLGLICAACGGSDDDSGEPSCSLGDRSGTYLVELEPISGNCGEQASALLRLDPEAPLGDNCALTQADEVSEDQCSFTRSTICAFDVLEPGAAVSGTAITRQQNSDGSLLTGTITMSIVDSQGLAVCFGTYRIRAERQ